MNRSMRFVTFIFIFLFANSLADASQQVLLRVQWQQLALNQETLSRSEKLSRVQDLSAFIALQSDFNTKVGKVPHQVFTSGLASEAELAFTKWVMFTNLGFAPEQFRLVYLQHSPTLTNHVWLAMYDTQGGKIITSNQIVDQSQLESILINDQLQIVSVLDPNQVLNSRMEKRRAENQVQDMLLL